MSLVAGVNLSPKYRILLSMVVSRLPLYEQVYKELRDQIASGQLLPGRRLDIQDIADKLKVSRTPTREAVRQLTHDGLVEMDRDGRSSVSSASLPDLAEIYTVRAALEATAAYLVAIRRSADLGPLEETIERAEGAYEQGNWMAVSTAHAAFHKTLIGMSQSTSIIRILDTFEIRTSQHRRISMQSDVRRRAAMTAHSEILEFLKSGQADAAKSRVRLEMIEAGEFAIHCYDNDPSDDTPSMHYLRVSAQAPNINSTSVARI